MTQRFGRLLVASLLGLACAAVAGASLWRPTGYVRTEDRNGDGRPDVWHTYNRLGHLSEVTVDTNFDGRSDVHEYYERGALLRRESDRDFNDHVDLVQEFDPATREHARSVFDTDFDGIADVLVLFQGDKPVFWKWARPVSPAGAGLDATRSANISARPTDGLAPLADPFAGDLAVRAARVAVGFDDGVAFSTSTGLPAACVDVASPLASSTAVLAFSSSHPSSASAVSYSPRGPPSSRLLS